MLFYFLILLFFDLFQISSFLNGKYFQTINLKPVPFLAQNIPFNNVIKRKRPFNFFRKIDLRPI